MKRSKTNTLYSYFFRKKKYTRIIGGKSFYKNNMFKNIKRNIFKKYRKKKIISKPINIKSSLKIVVLILFSIMYCLFSKINIEEDYGLSLE